MFDFRPTPQKSVFGVRETRRPPVVLWLDVEPGLDPPPKIIDPPLTQLLLFVMFPPPPIVLTLLTLPKY